MTYPVAEFYLEAEGGINVYSSLALGIYSSKNSQYNLGLIWTPKFQAVYIISTVDIIIGHSPYIWY